MAASNPSSRAYFEQQREALMGEIATSFEQVLANINKLNRNLEAVITVGNEFSSVEALWSTFENVMAKEEGEADEAAEGKVGEETDGGVDDQGQGEIEGADEDQERTVT
ncbi:DASH complex subunit Dad1-domain-containing protein [Diaporthe sp. PMI_573]|nr:DASH complex subunit Dad1-domain-containing protein [Diaporthaceae sp. PMI_573]